MEKKNFTLVAMALFCSCTYAQVGVNTSTPETTLDVRAKNHLGAVTSTDGILAPRVNSLTTAGTINGQLVYLVADNGGFAKGFHYWNGTAWTPFTGGGSGSGDPTKDAWVDNAGSARVEVGTLSDGTTARPTGTEMVIKDDGKLGVGTTTPASTMHVNGDMSLVKDLKVGGDAATAGSAGSVGQVLTSNGPNAAPIWRTNTTLEGGLVFADIYLGTSIVNVGEGQTKDVPGLSGTIVVPPGMRFWNSFLITGIMNAVTVSDTGQGVFSLVVDGVKVTSAYSSKSSDQGTHFGSPNNLFNLPSPVTFMKGVYLNEGTHSWKIQFKSWFGNNYVNYEPVDYSGYDGDNESFKSRVMLTSYVDNL